MQLSRSVCRLHILALFIIMATCRETDAMSVENKVLPECEIMWTPEQQEYLRSMTTPTSDRHGTPATKSLFKRWPNKIVYYEIDPTFASWQVDMIKNATHIWEDNTCLTFTQRSSGSRIFFTPETGCGSYIGIISESFPQKISLQHSSTGTCFKIGIILHEIGHALGLFHEQTRPDRDNYVTIHTNHIQPGKEYNFRKLTWNEVIAHGLQYDYGSVMHYGRYAFSINGEPTISTSDPTLDNLIGQRDGLSDDDIRIVNLMYNCPASELVPSCSEFGDICLPICPRNRIRPRTCNGIFGGRICCNLFGETSKINDTHVNEITAEGATTVRKTSINGVTTISQTKECDSPAVDRSLIKVVESPYAIFGLGAIVFGIVFGVSLPVLVAVIYSCKKQTSRTAKKHVIMTERPAYISGQYLQQPTPLNKKDLV